MHEQKELIEELREYCLQKQKLQLLTSYLKCFLEEGKSNECLTKVGIDTVEIKNCMTVTDTTYKVTKIYNDKSKWYNNQFPYFNVYKEDNTKYNIQGSPDLVINGKTMASGRDPESLLELICSAFNNPPEECKTKLSSTAQNPGFGFKLAPGDLSHNFVMSDNAGNNFEFYKYKGRAPYKLLLFWSAGCEHCLTLVKGLSQWYKESGNKEKLDIIAVSLDATETEVQKWNDTIVNLIGWKHLRVKEGVNSPIAKDYSILNTPAMFLVGSKSNIIKAIPDNFEDLIKDLEK
jgi:thiol-disulfide isomerase/thioredoxin